jgi:dienelactone hydrolase
MTEVVLFHHVQGLTDGVAAFAEDLRAGGHTVHVPDLFDGHTFGSIEDGFAYTSSLADGTLDRRVADAVEGLASEVVYAGISYGVPRALDLTVNRPGAKALVMLESAMPVAGEDAFGPFPDGVPVQIHGGEGDEYFQEDKEYADQAVEVLGDRVELFVYPTDAHLFTDRSLPSYDAESAALATRRILELLDRV